MKRITNPITALLLAALAAGPALLAGCGGGDHEHEEESPNEEACEHIAGGPFADVVAAAAPGADAKEIDATHKTYRVKLADGAGGKTGFVRFVAAARGEYLFFTSAPATVKVTSAAMAEVPVKSQAASIAECAQVKGRHAFDLQVGTYYVSVTSVEETVGVVVEPAAH
jgi:hypothetical protein